MKRMILLAVFLLGIAIVALAQPTGGIGSFPPPNNGLTGFTYRASNNTFHFTRTDGSFSSVVVFDNSAEPGYPTTHDFSVDAVGTDGQRNLATYHFNTQMGAYELSSLLDLDQDGHFSLGGSGGGGIATDPSTGDTCIPYNPLIDGTCNMPNSLHIAVGGTIKQYQGLRTTGNGITSLVKVINGSATGTVTNYPVWPVPASGYGASDYYELSWAGVVTTPAFATRATAAWSFTDESGPNSCISAPVTFSNVGDRLELTCHFYSVPGTLVSISVSTNGGSPTYESYLRVTIL